MPTYVYPPTPAGDEITETMLQSGLPIFVEKADTNGRSVTTLSNDPDLQLSVPANSRWWIEMHLVVQGSATGDLKTAWSVPTGSTGGRRVEGPGSTASDLAEGSANLSRFGVHGYTTSVVYPTIRTTNGELWVAERALVGVGATAGVIALQWAQNAADTTTLTYVRPGSLLIAHRLA